MIQRSPGGVAVQVTARVLWLCVWLVRPSVHPPAPVLSHFSSFPRPPVAGPSSLRPRGCLCLAGRCGCCAVCPVRVQFECAGVVLCDCHRRLVAPLLPLLLLVPVADGVRCYLCSRRTVTLCRQSSFYAPKYATLYCILNLSVPFCAKTGLALKVVVCVVLYRL